MSSPGVSRTVLGDAEPRASPQGIETVRRDNCLLVRDVITTSLEKMLIEKDVDGAVAYVKGMISNLLMNRIDLSLLVITKVAAAGRAVGSKHSLALRDSCTWHMFVQRTVARLQHSPTACWDSLFDPACLAPRGCQRRQKITQPPRARTWSWRRGCLRVTLPQRRPSATVCRTSSSR